MCCCQISLVIPLPYFFLLSGNALKPGVVKVGWCMESEIGPFNTPTSHSNHRVVLGVFNSAAECVVITQLQGLGW